MADNSKIEWTDHTVNLWWGCTKVHAGCDHCYAETLSKRFGDNIWGNESGRKRIKSAFSKLDQYQKQSEKEGRQIRVFVGSMMDIFEKPMKLNNPIQGDKYTTEHLRIELFDKIENGYWKGVTFLFLTKRPSNINRMIPTRWKYESPPKNVWLGCSPVDQDTYDNFMKHMSKVKGNKFLSIEPQLAPIGLGNIDWEDIEWIIQGGESGPKKRKFELAWAVDMKEQCIDRGIPYFFKQIDKVKPIPQKHLIREFPEEIK